MTLDGRALANTGAVTSSNNTTITSSGSPAGSSSAAAIFLYQGTSLTPASNILIGNSAQLFLPLIGTNPFMLSVSLQSDHASYHQPFEATLPAGK